MSYYFTSESVTEGHPDKVADRVSDAILDAALAKDPYARVACETFITRGVCIVGGEITADAALNIPEIARETIEGIGYRADSDGFDCRGAEFQVLLREQAHEIGSQVDCGGAGDQGLMFGYACSETEELMPLPIVLAHRLAQRLSEARKSGLLPYLRPDGKTQVTVEYADSGKPLRVAKVLVSAQHSEEIDLETLRAHIAESVVRSVVLGDENTDIRVNPNGPFTVGGPNADTGLTGRKIIVDTYGGTSRHGGGAFSGKDPTKVDRSAAYMMRYVAKNIVAAGLAKRCEVQVSYGIGDTDAFSLRVDTFGAGVVSDNRLSAVVSECFDMSPAGIIEHLRLRRPIYAPLSAYGHFGREGFPWEDIDRADDIRKAAGLD